MMPFSISSSAIPRPIAHSKPLREASGNNGKPRRDPIHDGGTPSSSRTRALQNGHDSVGAEHTLHGSEDATCFC